METETAVPLSYLATLYLNELEDHYDQHGSYPEKIKYRFITPLFRKALTSRGLPPVDSPTDLSPTQRAVIRSVSDYTDTKTLRGKLKDLGVTTTEYQKWLKDPKFFGRLEAAISKINGYAKLDATVSLAQLIQSRDLNAIKYFNEVTGVYRPNQESVLNLGVILGVLMEILVKYLDPADLLLVANEVEAKVLPQLLPGSTD